MEDVLCSWVSLDGVAHASVNLTTERADVDFDPDTLTSADIAAAIGRAGYSVPAETVELAIGGMTCASCVSRVEGVTAKLPGVLTAAVNLATAKATVSFTAGTLDAAVIAAL